MSFFYINPFVEEKKCTLSVAYNFTNWIHSSYTFYINTSVCLKMPVWKSSSILKFCLLTSGWWQPIRNGTDIMVHTVKNMNISMCDEFYSCCMGSVDIV
jgi:hypothetical protein